MSSSFFPIRLVSGEADGGVLGELVDEVVHGNLVDVHARDVPLEPDIVLVDDEVVDGVTPLDLRNKTTLSGQASSRAELIKL